MAIVQSPGCAVASTWCRKLLIQTSCVGFCAGGAVGFVVFGAALDAGCCFFLPYFPPPLAAAFPPAVEVVGFARCFLE